MFNFIVLVWLSLKFPVEPNLSLTFTYFWRINANKRKIARKKQDFAEKKRLLHERLTGDQCHPLLTEKRKCILGLSFKKLLQKLRDGMIDPVEVLEAYQVRRFRCWKINLEDVEKPFNLDFRLRHYLRLKRQIVNAILLMRVPVGPQPFKSCQLLKGVHCMDYQYP